MMFLPLPSNQLQIPQHKGQWSQTPWLLPAKRSVKRQAHHIWLNWNYYSIQFHQFHQCSSCNGVLQEVCLQKIRFRNKPSLHFDSILVCMAASSAKNAATPALGMENHGSAPSRFASSTICSTQTPNWPCQWLQVQKTSRFYVAFICFLQLSALQMCVKHGCPNTFCKLDTCLCLICWECPVLPASGLGSIMFPFILRQKREQTNHGLADWLLKNGATNFRWQGATICQRENRSSVVPFSISKKRGWKSCVVAFCA